MNVLIAILLCSLASTAGVPLTRCIGDLHDGCPMLVAREQEDAAKGCTAARGTEGWTQATLEGTLGRQDGDTFRPIREAEFLRECLDGNGDLVRSCPLAIRLKRNGGFKEEVWLKSGVEIVCDRDYRVTRAYEEKVRMRIRAEGCEDLVVDFDWAWRPKRLLMTCAEGGKK